jgi:ribosomal L7/L12-like protein
VTWYWAGGIALVVLLGLVSRRGERSASGPRPRNDLPLNAATIDGLLQAGQKIAAIKAYRELHGVGLKEAKDAVEARTRALRR